MKPSSPKLSELLVPLEMNLGDRQPDPRIASIHYRAQAVAAGGLFVAIPGLRHDGADFIGQAIENGAAAVLTQTLPEKNLDTGEAVIIQVPDARRALAAVASRFYGRPSEKMCVVGITGTNGKTTCAHLIENMLAEAGFKTGLIGTIDYRYGGQCFENPVTTPESADLQRILADMRSCGVTHVVMEASSHAIDLHRIDFCFMDLAVFTNLSQDHLDYHGDMETYWACKKRLFSEHLKTGPKKKTAKAVVNMADSHGRELAGELGGLAVRVNLGQTATVWAPQIEASLSGITGEIETPDGGFQIRSSLLGQFNLENILCAAGAGWALGLAPEKIKAGIETLAGVPGRLEPVSNSNGKHIFVDYAHTPDALKNVLAAARDLGDGRLICVFGCGGERDVAKRAQMGIIAAKWADLVLVTSDNPRSEDPLAIIDQIVDGISKIGMGRIGLENLLAGKTDRGFLVESDRRRAIEAGIKVAGRGDIVVIAGKGHEDYQIIGSQKIDFDDRKIAREVLGGA